ncbi:hypothetical protein ERO13_A11G048800v2 [Gossypium hirsutum]|uniref:VQ domain-containing protein n=3 Tax=Gossypium TaxID=3633 RepID=A0ABR0MZT5_GOSAR|nr:uncharacterized protein LOC107923228 [Gossypium hirsutum]XP_017636701.1 uncharacterized protein LOC108478746 [Gossypium arboreum]KAG4173277.1 hypothetical protein ERO13_A11G048800v2 [Gossypium hirsutum]KAK5783072.1 hypothetical protein PVK06_037580 [Gossypium arboreum]TYJ08182.1 hypothetical protein E1A91_A11G056200v1 [Gossypium mustelinum]
MEANYSSSSSSSSLARGLKVPQSFHASIHSVRKPLTKPWKKPTSPLLPTPPKVYKVDPINFRDLVQKLTGAVPPCSISQPQQHHRLQRVAPPPPLQVAPPPFMCGAAEVNSAPFHLVSGLDHAKPQKENFSDDAMITSNSLGFSLSPSSYNYNWCSFPILSPRT